MTAEVRRQLSPAAGSCSSCGRVAGSAAGTNKKPSEAGLDQWEASRSPVAANQKRRRLQELAGDTMGVATPHSRHYLEPLDPAERGKRLVCAHELNIYCVRLVTPPLLPSQQYSEAAVRSKIFTTGCSIYPYITVENYKSDTIYSF